MTEKPQRQREKDQGTAKSSETTPDPNVKPPTFVTVTEGFGANKIKKRGRGNDT